MIIGNNTNPKNFREITPFDKIKAMKLMIKLGTKIVVLNRHYFGIKDSS